MKQVFVKSQINDMPKWAKGIVGVAAVVLTAFVIREVYKAIKKSAVDKSSKEVVNDASGELDALLKSGMKLSNASSVYSSTANTIEKMLDGCETSTTEMKVVKNIIAIVKNKADWLQLVKVFGTRSISDCGTWGQAHTTYDLPTILKDQLDSYQIFIFEKVGSSTYNGAKNTIDVLQSELKKLGITL